MSKTRRPDAIIEQLRGFVTLGFTAFNLLPLGDRDEQLHRLADEVVPALRD